MPEPTIVALLYIVYAGVKRCILKCLLTLSKTLSNRVVSVIYMHFNLLYKTVLKYIPRLSMQIQNMQICLREIFGNVMRAMGNNKTISHIQFNNVT